MRWVEWAIEYQRCDQRFREVRDDYESIDERDLVSILVQVDVEECGEALPDRGIVTRSGAL